MNFNDLKDREQEIWSLFKSQDITQSANRLFDFVSDFSGDRESRKDCIVFCNRATNIEQAEKRKKFRDFSEYQDKVTELLYDMMEQLEQFMDRLGLAREAA